MIGNPFLCGTDRFIYIRLNGIPMCINSFFPALKCHGRQYFKTKFEEFISCFNNQISSLQIPSGNLTH